MIVWCGRGFLILVVYIASAFAFHYLYAEGTESLTNATAAFLTAAFSWYFGNRWNSAKGKIVIDEETGERFEIKNNHSLFWIKMQYYGIIFSGLGVMFLTRISITFAVIASIFLCALFAYIFLQTRKRNKAIEENAYETMPLSKEKMLEEGDKR